MPNNKSEAVCFLVKYVISYFIINYDYHDLYDNIIAPMCIMHFLRPYAHQPANPLESPRKTRWRKSRGNCILTTCILTAVKNTL